jgi:hypothetical protein
MSISQREIQLSQALISLQAQFNRMISTVEFWREKAEERQEEIMRLNREEANERSKSYKEIERLTKLLDSATSFEAPTTTAKKRRTKKDAEGA